MREMNLSKLHISKLFAALDSTAISVKGSRATYLYPPTSIMALHTAGNE